MRPARSLKTMINTLYASFRYHVIFQTHISPSYLYNLKIKMLVPFFKSLSVSRGEERVFTLLLF